MSNLRELKLRSEEQELITIYQYIKISVYPHILAAFRLAQAKKKGSHLTFDTASSYIQVNGQAGTQGY